MNRTMTPSNPLTRRLRASRDSPIIMAIASVVCLEVAIFSGARMSPWAVGLGLLWIVTLCARFFSAHGDESVRRAAVEILQWQIAIGSFLTTAVLTVAAATSTFSDALEPLKPSLVWAAISVTTSVVGYALSREYSRHKELAEQAEAREDAQKRWEEIGKVIAEEIGKAITAKLEPGPLTRPGRRGFLRRLFTRR